MKTLFILLSISLSSLAFSNVNGGYIHVCEKNGEKIYELYDFVDGELDDEVPWTLEAIDENLTYEEIFNKVLKKIKRVNPTRALIYKQWFSEFNQEKSDAHGDIITSNDIGLGTVRSGCEGLKLLIAQRTPNGRKKRYKVNKPLWDLLLQKEEHLILAGVLIHEFVYRELRDHQKTSISTRYLVNYFFSNEIKNHDQKEYNDILRAEYMPWVNANEFIAPLYNIGHLKRWGKSTGFNADYYGYDDEIIENIKPINWKYYENGQLKEISFDKSPFLPKAVHLFRYSGLEKKLFNIDNTYLAFRNNGSIKEFTIRDESLLKVNNCTLEIVKDIKNKWFLISTHEDFGISAVRTGFNKSRINYTCIKNGETYKGNARQIKINFDKEGDFTEIITYNEKLSSELAYLKDVKYISWSNNKTKWFNGIKLLKFKSSKIDFKTAKNEYFRCTDAAFFENGTLSSCRRDNERDKIEIKLANGTKESCDQVDFYPSGNIKGCYRDYRKNSTPYSYTFENRDDLIYNKVAVYNFDTFPKIYRVKYRENQLEHYTYFLPVSAGMFAPAKGFELYPNGKIKKFYSLYPNTKHSTFGKIKYYKVKTKVGKKIKKLPLPKKQWVCLNQKTIVIPCQ